MKHEGVEGSSTIKSVAYDPATKRMQVAFTSGTYELEDVNQSNYDTFLAAARDKETSTGKHYNTHFKGQYKFKKL